MAKPTGMKKRPMATQKAGNVSQRRQHREFDDRRGNDAAGGAERERDSAADRPDRLSATATGARSRRRPSLEAPFGQAVATQKSSTAPIATNARAALTSSRQPIGHAEPEAAMAGQEAGQGHRRAAPARRARAICRPAPWLFRRRAAAAMACRPAGRAASAPPPRKRGAEPTGSAIQRAGELAPAPIAARAEWLRRMVSAACRSTSSGKRLRCAATARQPSSAREQAVDGGLQCRRVVAHVAGLPERLVDHRVERDDAPDEFASLGLRVRQLRPRQCQHAGKSARDLGRQIGE